MSDTKTRELERRAAQGDPDAVEALNRDRERIYGVKTIVDYARCEVGDWVYLEFGSNYHDIGKLVEVGLNEFGVGIVVLSHVRRKENETTGAAPTFLFEQARGVTCYPTSDIVCCAKASDRYGNAFKPWA